LCQSVEEKLSKRKGALTRSKDRLKLECDRRYVRTEHICSVNEPNFHKSKPLAGESKLRGKKTTQLPHRFQLKR